MKLRWCIQESITGHRIIAKGYKWLSVMRFNGMFFEPAVAGIPQHILLNGSLGPLNQVHVLCTFLHTLSIYACLTLTLFLYTVFPASGIFQRSFWLHAIHVLPILSCVVYNKNYLCYAFGPPSRHGKSDVFFFKLSLIARGWFPVISLSIFLNSSHIFKYPLLPTHSLTHTHPPIHPHSFF